jgi:hypothetical protein
MESLYNNIWSHPAVRLTCTPLARYGTNPHKIRFQLTHSNYVEESHDDQ